MPSTIHYWEKFQKNDQGGSSHVHEMKSFAADNLIKVYINYLRKQLTLTLQQQLKANVTFVS